MFNPATYILFLEIKTDSLFTYVPSNMANEIFREITSDASHLKILVRNFKEYLFKFMVDLAIE